MKLKVTDILTIVAASAALLALSLLLPARIEPESPVRSLRLIVATGQIRVLTQNTPTTYYIDKDGAPGGPEYELIKAFSDSLGVEPVFIVKDTLSELLAATEAGEADMAAAGLSITLDRAPRFYFGPSYQRVSQQVVCRLGGPRPKSILDLVGVDLVVIAGSSYEERLIAFRENYPEFEWRVSEGVSSEQLLEKVWQREIDCTVMDSNIVSINQRYFPELRVRFELPPQDSLAWILPHDSQSLALQRQLQTWFADTETSTLTDAILERYYGHVALFDYVDTAQFIRRIRQRYPKYSQYFATAAEHYDLSETLLAAQSYQESHWNPLARSPTGVRGMMMLTLPTAKALGIGNRLDPEASIMGGARYFAQLKNKLAEEADEPDLTWLALAAYNVGLGHLRDAQTLAVAQGKNPESWVDIKEILPLLSDKAYYRTLKYGYARGMEPVRYVQQIREYEHILSQQLIVAEMAGQEVVPEG